MDAKEFVRLKEELERERTAAARFQGKREILLQRLGETHNCHNLSEAEALATKLDAELSSLKTEYQTKLAAYRQNQGSRLD